MTNTIHWPNVGLKLGQRRRRWPNINPALGQFIVLTGMYVEPFSICNCTTTKNVFFSDYIRYLSICLLSAFGYMFLAYSGYSFFSNSLLHSDKEKGCTFLYITMQQEQLQYQLLKPRELNICGYLASGFLAFSGYRFLALWPSQISWLMHSRSCSWWRTWLWRTLLDWLSALTRGAAKTMLHCLIIIK